MGSSFIEPEKELSWKVYSRLKNLEYGSGASYAGFPSSQAFGVGGGHIPTSWPLLQGARKLAVAEARAICAARGSRRAPASLDL